MNLQQHHQKIAQVSIQCSTRASDILRLLHVEKLLFNLDFILVVKQKQFDAVTPIELQV